MNFTIEIVNDDNERLKVNYKTLLRQRIPKSSKRRGRKKVLKADVWEKKENVSII